MGLPCHNEQMNSSWMFVTDLEGVLPYRAFVKTNEMIQPDKDWEEVLVNNFLTKKVKGQSLSELRSSIKRQNFFNKI